MNDIKVFEKILDSQHNQRKFLTDVRFKETQSKKPLIIFIHGFKGLKDWGHFNMMADYFANSGFVYAKLNMSHNGTDPEHPLDFVDLEAFANNNFSIELDDLGTFIDHLFSNASKVPVNEIDLNRVYLLGHSRGGGVAIVKAGEDQRMTGLITLAAISKFNVWNEKMIDEWEQNGVIQIYNGRTKQHMPIYKQWKEDTEENHERLNIARTAKHLNKPWLIIHGTEDETLPLVMAETLHQWCPKSELFIIEGAGHTFGGGHPFDKAELPKHTLIALNKSIQFLQR